MAGINKKNPFILPERLNPANLDDEYDHKRFKQLVFDLPLGNVSSAARALHSELGRMNHLEMSPMERFEALELLISPLGFVLDKLRVYYTSAPSPLSKKNRLVARLHLELIVRVIIGYKTVMAQFHDGSFTGYFLHKHTRVDASRRLLYFLGELLQHEYSIYNAGPKFVWKEIHGVYYYAVQNDLVSGEGDIPKDDPCGPLGAVGHYKRILLLALANPSSLLRGEVKKVSNALPRWLPEVSVLPLTDEVSTQTIFIVDAQKDAPPRVIAACDKEKIKKGWILDTSKLDGVLQREINSIQGNNGTRLRPTDAVSIKLLSKLRAAWGRGITLREERRKKTGIIDVACGLGSLYQLLGGERLSLPPAEETGSPFCSVETGEEGLAVEKVDHDEFIIDAGSQLSSGFASESEPVNEMEIELDIIDSVTVEEIDSRECISVNESNKGCYLTWPGEGECKVHVGELIGINPREAMDLSGAWSLGVIRWVRIQSHGLMGFGVELLDGEIEPVSLERWCNGDSQVDTMLGFQQKIAGNLVSVITQPFYVGDKDRFLLVEDNQQLTIVPGQILECTDAVMRFTIEIASDSVGQADENARTYSASDDPFNTIWDDLDS